MSGKLRLLCVLAHPDDESLGTGGVLAKYGQEGVETYLITATLGQRGWAGPEDQNPGSKELGRMRAAELRAAARVLNIRELHLLGYMDGEVDQAPAAELVGRLTRLIRQIRPQVVVTFGPEGAYGHPDHIAISQYTTAAVVQAADANIHNGEPPHAVSKLYYKVWTAPEVAAYQSVFGDLVMTVDGVERRFVSWPEWAITTRVDTIRHWPQVWESVCCHQSQLPAYEALADLEPEHHAGLWGCHGFYRVFSTVNGGRVVEDDLFAGLR